MSRIYNLIKSDRTFHDDDLSSCYNQPDYRAKSLEIWEARFSVDDSYSAILVQDTDEVKSFGI